MRCAPTSRVQQDTPCAVSGLQACHLYTVRVLSHMMYGSRSEGEECGRGGAFKGVVGRGETKLMPWLKLHCCNQFSYSCAFHANVGLVRPGTTLQKGLAPDVQGESWLPLSENIPNEGHILR